MSEYSEYADKAAGVGKGKHAKGSGDGGENAGCMTVAPLPAVVVGTLLAAVARWSRRR